MSIFLNMSNMIFILYFFMSLMVLLFGAFYFVRYSKKHFGDEEIVKVRNFSIASITIIAICMCVFGTGYGIKKYYIDSLVDVKIMELDEKIKTVKHEIHELESPVNNITPNQSAFKNYNNNELKFHITVREDRLYDLESEKAQIQNGNFFVQNGKVIAKLAPSTSFTLKHMK